VELSNFKADWINTRNAIEMAKADLNKVMGVSQDSKFTLSDKLVYETFDITMEQAVNAAYHNRPDLFGRQIDIKLQKELLDIARSRYWPSINGFYDFSLAKPDPHNPTSIEWGRAWNLGVGAALPLFDGFSREGDIITQKARFKQSQINLVDAEETALLELTKAILSIGNAAEFVESQRMNLERAREGLRLAEAGYREGTNTQVEVLDAQTALTKARSLYYQAIYSHIIAKLSLQKSMGTITSFGEARAPEQQK
jgi:outer membrane protein TolC